ncbi:hypothetical protein [Streptomyces sp. G-G2]|uniref:hypothetical protein n=1 Tax=Streptomyces sp. G-G2 TaxID=3046201 RepID=UPI0024BBB14B|nr:hypothetical protein [Streptomyces sp. G-G2]MDJ0383704.1 hypothetical protein [Streptomyces sp. G-G2]
MGLTRQAGTPYAGTPYAGTPYAGTPYAGTPYAGAQRTRHEDVGPGTHESPVSSPTATASW